jgi:hypothetical protein
MKNSVGFFHRFSGFHFILAIILIDACSLSAQDTLSNGKALSLPFRKYGISIGNSYEFNGIRINFADKNVRKINGLNITLWLKMFQNQNAIVNGISFGVMPTAGIMQPVNIGLVGLGTANRSNGLTLAGLMIGGDINGLGLSGLFIMADGRKGMMSGFALSGLMVGAKTELNGVTIGGLIVGSEGDINGLAGSSTYIQSGGVVRGVALTAGYLNAMTFKGIAIAGYFRSTQMHGLSFAVFNSTKELHGTQVGLLNIARNNPKGLRVLPVINMHLKNSQ